MLDWMRLEPYVKQAASKALASFPEHHSAQEVEQELWVWVMANKNTCLRVLSDPDSTPAALSGLLVKAANSHLKKADAAVYEYDPDDRYEYSFKEVQDGLEIAFSYEDWQSFATHMSGLPRTKSNPARSGDHLAKYADIKSAVEKLEDEDEYNALLWRYKYHKTYDEIADLVDLETKGGAKRRVDAAVRAVQKLLGESPLSDLRRGYSGRSGEHHLSNAEARRIVERDYEG